MCLRHLSPVDNYNIPQQVFYGEGIGAEHDTIPEKILAKNQLNLLDYLNAFVSFNNN